MNPSLEYTREQTVLVDRAGARWEIYDVTLAPLAGWPEPSRQLTPHIEAACRVFTAIGDDREVRIYRFAEGESRALDPFRTAELRGGALGQKQLDEATRAGAPPLTRARLKQFLAAR